MENHWMENHRMENHRMENPRVSDLWIGENIQNQKYILRIYNDNILKIFIIFYLFFYNC